jgi:hypothetical protein
MRRRIADADAGPNALALRIRAPVPLRDDDEREQQGYVLLCQARPRLEAGGRGRPIGRIRQR